MNKFKVLFFLPLCMVIPLLVVGCLNQGKANSSNDNVLLLGFQGPLTGENAFFGKSALAGIELAIEEINNDGGINDKLIELVYADSKSDKGEAVEIAKDMVALHVCAVIGEPTSSAAEVTLDIYNNGKTPILLSSATATGLTDGKPFVFRNALIDIKGLPFLLDYIIFTQNLKNFAIISIEGDTYSEGFAELFRYQIPRKGAKVIAEQSIKESDTDFSKQVAALRNKNIDVIAFTGYYQQGAAILLELEKQGVDAIMVGADGLQSSELWEVAKDASIGTLLFAAFSPNIDTERIKKFNKKLRDRNATPNIDSSQAYDAVYLIAKALTKADVQNCSDESNRIKIKDNIARIRYFDGISGKMSFDLDRNAIKAPYIQEVYKIGNNNYDIRVVE